MHNTIVFGTGKCTHLVGPDLPLPSLIQRHHVSRDLGVVDRDRVGRTGGG